jgi:hypothetical protein
MKHRQCGPWLRLPGRVPPINQLYVAMITWLAAIVAVSSVASALTTQEAQDFVQAQCKGMYQNAGACVTCVSSATKNLVSSR